MPKIVITMCNKVTVFFSAPTKVLTTHTHIMENDIDVRRSITWSDQVSSVAYASELQKISCPIRRATCCSVCKLCMSDFVSEDMVSRVRCGHLFHSQCLQEWLQCTSLAQNECPYCRQSLLHDQLVMVD